jgi:DNA primase
VPLADSQKRYLAKASQEYEGQLGSISPSHDPNGVIAYFREHAVTFEIAQKYRLGYVTTAGVVSVNYRALGDTKPKYLKPHGQKARLFNAKAYFEADDAIGLSEGEMDAIAATEHLGIPTMGVPGATNFDPLWLPLFKDFQRVLIFADGDEAGSTFANETAELIGWRARIVTCAPGEDVSSMCAAGKASELIQLATVRDE